MSQLKDLSKPFPDSVVKEKPSNSGPKLAYVSHANVTERLLQVVGPYSLEDVQPIRGHAAEIKGKKKDYPAVENAIVGALVTLRCEVDGRMVRITEAGDVESPAMKETDGARLKDAVSDAFKRCAMRLGLGLHLWAGEGYFLHKSLERDEREEPESAYTGSETVGDVLGPERGEAAAETLRERGIRAPLAFAKKVLAQPELKSLEFVTEAEAKTLLAAAKGQQAKQAA